MAPFDGLDGMMLSSDHEAARSSVSGRDSIHSLIPYPLPQSVDATTGFLNAYATCSCPSNVDRAIARYDDAYSIMED